MEGTTEVVMEVEAVSGEIVEEGSQLLKEEIILLVQDPMVSSKNISHPETTIIELLIQ